MEKLIVQKKSLAYANDGSSGTVTMDTINLLADGAVALFGEDGALMAYNTGASAFNEANVYVGNAEVGPIFMGTIYPREFSYATSVYAAAATKIMCIGGHSTDDATYNLNPATLVVGDVARIQIIDLSKRHDDISRYHNYESQVLIGDTITTLMTRLVAKINADTKKCITTATLITHDAVANGVLLTGKALVDFTASAAGLIGSADVIEYKNVLAAHTGGVTKGYASGLTTPLVAFGSGKNTYAQLQQLEHDTDVFLGDQGLITTRNNTIFKLKSRLESGTTYSTFVLSCKAPNNMGGLIEADNFTNVFTFAAYVGDAGNTYLAPVLANVATVLGAKSY